MKVMPRSSRSEMAMRKWAAYSKHAAKRMFGYGGLSYSYSRLLNEGLLCLTKGKLADIGNFTLTNYIPLKKKKKAPLTDNQIN